MTAALLVVFVDVTDLRSWCLAILPHVLVPKVGDTPERGIWGLPKLYETCSGSSRATNEKAKNRKEESALLRTVTSIRLRGIACQWEYGQLECTYVCTEPMSLIARLRLDIRVFRAAIIYRMIALEPG